VNAKRYHANALNWAAVSQGGERIQQRSRQPRSDWVPALSRHDDFPGITWPLVTNWSCNVFRKPIARGRRTGGRGGQEASFAIEHARGKFCFCPDDYFIIHHPHDS
jgi:hypothetical protein